MTIAWGGVSKEQESVKRILKRRSFLTSRSNVRIEVRAAHRIVKPLCTRYGLLFGVVKIVGNNKHNNAVTIICIII